MRAKKAFTNINISALINLDSSGKNEMRIEHMLTRNSWRKMVSRRPRRSLAKHVNRPKASNTDARKNIINGLTSSAEIIPNATPE